VPIARVTDLFLARGMESQGWSSGDLEEASWFLVMCALMLELKVGRLMPRRPARRRDGEICWAGRPPTCCTRESLRAGAFRRVAEDLAERMAAAALPGAAGGGDRPRSSPTCTRT
jgi:chromatin segregation and condensation protein Rec8/ScpA/Scc1 (kleisin family)